MTTFRQKFVWKVEWNFQRWLFIVEGKLAILAAVQECQFKVLEVLFNWGANPVHLSINQGDTPIHAALSIALERDKGIYKFCLGKTFIHTLSARTWCFFLSPCTCRKFFYPELFLCNVWEGPREVPYAGPKSDKCWGGWAVPLGRQSQVQRYDPESYRTVVW